MCTMFIFSCKNETIPALYQFIKWYLEQVQKRLDLFQAHLERKSERFNTEYLRKERSIVPRGTCTLQGEMNNQ